MKKWRFCLLIFLIVLLWEVLPVASAENGKIAFTSFRDGNGEIYVMNADGTGQARLTSNPAYDGEPAWSPNGSKIAFTSYRYGNSDIYVMNRDGTGQTRLTNYTAYDREPAWSPDGSKIVFVSWRDGNDEIYLMNADGTGQTRLTNYTAYDREPAWSPDGSEIAFGSWRNGNSDICIMNPDGIGQTYLTSNTVYDGEPAWSPDGSKISFTSNRDGNNQIYLMNPDGSGQTRITTNTENDYHPVWSTDGLKIAFVSSRDGNGEIYTMNPDGTEQTRVTYNTVYDEQPDWTTLEQIVLIANFTAVPISGTAPLTVSFTDLSTNNPTGWAWYFGDENYTVPWTQVNASARWLARSGHSSVALMDGSIVLMGGLSNSGYMNDVWRSTDNGATWTIVNASAGWSARESHSSVAMPDGSIVLMGGDESGVGDRKNDVWRSTDNGATWTEVNASAGWTPRKLHSSVAMPDGSIVLMGGLSNSGYMNDVWRSTDNGATWTLVNANAGWMGRFGHSSVVMPDGNIVLMGGDDGGFMTYKNDVWRSTDNGATWTLVNANAGWIGREGHSSVVMPDGSIVLTGGFVPPTTNNYRNDAWRSTDIGVTWTLVNANAGWTGRVRHSSVAMPDGSIVLMGGYHFSGNMNDVWRFMPTGSSAQNPSHTYTTPGTYQIALQAYNADGYDSTRKAGYITVNAPAPVANLTGTPTSGQAPLTVSFTDLSTNNPTGWAWYFGDENYSQAWTQQTASAGWLARYGHTSVAMRDGSVVLMGGSVGDLQNDVWRSMDNGITWQQMTANAGWSPRYLHSSVVMPDGSIVLMGGGYGKNDVWRSMDYGATWTQVNSSAGWSARSGHTSVVMSDGSIVLMGGLDSHVTSLNDVWRSTDNGSTWQQMTAGAGWSPRNFHSSVAMPDGSIVLIGGNNGTNSNDVWRSTDFGATWTEINASAGWSARNGHSSIAMSDGSIFLTGGYASDGWKNDVWRSTDNGATWTEVNASAGWPARRDFSSVAMSDGSIVLMGGRASDGVSSINDVWRLIPTGSSAQNPSHMYTIPGNYQVSLQVYNADGYNSTRKAGYITVNAPSAPVVNFTGTPTSGTAPLTVSFTDLSTNNPTGWAWYFGDETYAQAWTQQTASAGWSARFCHSSVVMPDGSIVLMGGNDNAIFRNDVWRSTDYGGTWTLMTASAGWSPRSRHSSVVMPDGSIVLMGGDEIGFANGFKNDVWRSTDNGATWTQVTAGAGWSARRSHCSTSMPDGSIVLMGGYASGGFKNDVWRSTDSGETWTQVNAYAGWAAREGHTCVVMPDGSIVLMGGNDGTMDYSNDVWRSTDYGATWTRMTASAGWGRRSYQTSAVMPDGSIVLMGGGGSGLNDVWQSKDSGATWTQVNSSAGWSARSGHTSVAMPDSSIVLMGGLDSHLTLLNDVWRLMPTSSEVQNPVHTYSTRGTYQVTLQAYNASGYNSTRKAGYITVYQGVEYGSSSGGDTPFSITSTPTTPPSGKTITETVNVGGGSAVTRAEMTGSDLGKNLVITAFPRKNLPSGVVAPPTMVYQYISIVSSAITGIVNRTTFDFSVPQSWLTEQGFTDCDIVMMHYDNGQWQTLDTRCVSQDGRNVLYRATTPGFSYFAVAYEKGGTTTDNTGTDNPLTTILPTTFPTTVAVLKAPVPDAVSPVPLTTEKTPAVPSAPVADRVGGIPLATIIIGIIGALAVIISTVLVRRWWTRKQNPALFRKYD